MLVPAIPAVAVDFKTIGKQEQLAALNALLAKRSPSQSSKRRKVSTSTKSVIKSKHASIELTPVKQLVKAIKEDDVTSELEPIEEAA